MALANNLVFKGGSTLLLKLKPMEKTYFTKLSADSKTELTWNYGEIITTVETKDIYISLFLLDTFYVEIYVNKFSNELQEVNLQDDEDILYEYIKDLNINAILPS
ncbi:hypothetical protein CNR22_00620 [Sphingobacteriaceae bacterium]|nr:hypothetical protein CNR22_00620 [Sphingobacteriaceae bacterium]